MNPHPRCRGEPTRGSIFERIATGMTAWAGTTFAFSFAVFLVLLWLAVGHLFHYSDTWQLVINTGTTIITFLMVFLIQRSQNRDMLALKIQMSELISSLKEADDDVIDLDDLTEKQLADLRQHYHELAHRVAEKLDAT